MKYLAILLFSFLFISYAYGQRGRGANLRKTSFVKIQPSLVYDWNNFKNYLGFKGANIGFNRIRKNRLEGIDLMAMEYNTGWGFHDSSTPDIDYYWQHSSIEVSYFNTFLMNSGRKAKLFIGPSMSLFYRSTISNKHPRRYKSQNSCYCLGIAPMFNYIFNVSRRFSLILTSRWNIIEIGRNTFRFHDIHVAPRFQSTREFHLKFLRPHFVFNIGIGFHF